MGKHLKSEYGKKKKGKGSKDGMFGFGHNARHFETKGHRGRSHYTTEVDDEEDEYSEDEEMEDGIIYVPVHTKVPKAHRPILPRYHKSPLMDFEEETSEEE
jgi:hypothetical protein|mmetsp:Transcript_2423/g.3329  ORF Transcript_2423/g.3329 Transcript_2423/m.3329 type:complete len:101 (-) Transcript_2423:1294-1596(-)